MELIGGRMSQVGGLCRGLAEMFGVGDGVEDLAAEVDGHPERSRDELGGRGVERLAMFGIAAQHRLPVDLTG